MTAPYFVIVSDTLAPTRPPLPESAVAGLTLAFSFRGTEVWSTAHVVKLGENGVVIGHLFSRSLPSRRVITIAPQDVDRIIASKGENLLQDYWGGYVAVILDAIGDLHVIRDPSGSIPAYWRRAGSRIFIAPEMGSAPFSKADGLQIDADVLTAHLWLPHHPGPETCIAGVRALVPGQGLQIGGQGISVRTLWSPWDYAARARSGDDYAPEHFRATVSDTIRAWGSCFRSILVGASGGLDSSIVSAGLAGCGADVCGHTMVGQDAEGDERAYAERVISAFGMGWEIDNYNLADIDLDAPIVPHIPTPFTAHYAQAIARSRERIAEARSIDAFFSGNGGDNVFCLMRSTAPLADRLSRFSSPGAILQTLFDIAHLTEADIGTILRLTVSRLRARRQTVRSVGDATRLDPARLESSLGRIEPHPWMTSPSAMLPGKVSHTRMIARAQGNDGFHSRRAHPPSIAPLLAQPIVELCLGIPTWAWVSGGVDRSVARHAFRGMLPKEIVERRSKGAPSGFMDLIYRKHEDGVQAGLVGGALHSLGILDRFAIEFASDASSQLDPTMPQRLLSLMAAEQWARSWM